jgi:hypothetical protein
MSFFKAAAFLKFAFDLDTAKLREAFKANPEFYRAYQRLDAANGGPADFEKLFAEFKVNPLKDKGARAGARAGAKGRGPSMGMDPAAAQKLFRSPAMRGLGLVNQLITYGVPLGMVGTIDTMNKAQRAALREREGVSSDFGMYGMPLAKGWLRDLGAGLAGGVGGGLLGYAATRGKGLKGPMIGGLLGTTAGRGLAGYHSIKGVSPAEMDKYIAKKKAKKEMAKAAEEKIMPITKLGIGMLEDDYVQPGYWEGAKGIVRAQTGGDASRQGYVGIRDADVIGSVLKNQLAGTAIGGAGGAGLGALLALLSRGRAAPATGAMIGGIGGALIGGSAGIMRGESKALERRGIRRTRPSHYLLGSGEFSPEAAEKYLNPAHLAEIRAAAEQG